MDATRALNLWARRLAFVAAGVSLIAGALNISSGHWRQAIGILALGLGFGLRALFPTGRLWLQVVAMVLFLLAGTMAVIHLVQRVGR
jgi:TRAP-type C4-dicarboxylate transport system permease small subunit